MAKDSKGRFGSCKSAIKARVFCHCYISLPTVSRKGAEQGYLVFKRFEVLKTHDLIKLTSLCFKFDRSFDKIYATTEQLNPFATKFRYPSEFDIPDLADAQLTIKHAQRIMNFVLKKISEPETGQTNLFEIEAKEED